ncbi:MAG: heavy-metal-associated domain-containing protein [Ferruginibacter sp.]
MKKISIIIIGVVFSLAANAQVKKLSLQASGLTCSMCSNAIYKSLKTIDFVQQVEANIATSTFDILVRPGSKVNFDQLKKKVEDAGFFVAALNATISFKDVAIVNDGHIELDGNTFHFLNSKDQVLNGEKTVRVLDKGFLPAKEFKKNNRLTLMECYKTGVAGACCVKDGLVAGTRIFHVSI